MKKKKVIVLVVIAFATLFSFYVSVDALTYSATSDFQSGKAYTKDAEVRTEEIARQVEADIHHHLETLKAENEDAVSGAERENTEAAIASIESYKQAYLEQLSGVEANPEEVLQEYEKRKKTELGEELEEEAQKMILKLFSE